MGSLKKFGILTLELTRPLILSISPRRAESNELFPEPTVPTTATRLPLFTVKFMFFNVGGSSGPQANVPFSMVRGASAPRKGNHKKRRYEKQF